MTATSALAAAVTEPTGTWYLGAGIGQTRGNVDNSTVSSVLAGSGATSAGVTNNSNTVGGKAFVGYQFNRFVAVEGGFFRLGNLSFDAATVPAGTVHGTMHDTMGWNLDVVGTAPIVPNKFLLLARLGIQTSKTSDLFVGTGAATALTNPAPSRNLISYKYGVGAEFDFTRNVGLRGEFERYRVSDGISGKMNINTFTASVLYRF
ncbi:MAG: outer membrane beta-barrel protein [Burkholderiales bacterium]